MTGTDSEHAGCDDDSEENHDIGAETSGGLSLHPLSPEDAMRGFMDTDPEKVKEAERHAKRERAQKRKQRKQRKKRAESDG